MKRIDPNLTKIVLCSLLALVLFGCDGNSNGSNTGQTTALANPNVIFLHHSTGQGVWDAGVAGWFTSYNTTNGASYQITERAYPSEAGYGWNNYPYDYWNIWVNHAGTSRYLTEDTLEILTGTYNVIIWKHCFPGSLIEEDTGTGDVTSDLKRLENYKLQYNALKVKMNAFTKVRFIVWTGAVQTSDSDITEAQATRMKAFADWVRNEWDETGDNIYIWDFYYWETGGASTGTAGTSLYLLSSYQATAGDSHPSSVFNTMVYPYFCRRVVNVIQGKGNSTSITGI